METPQFSLPLHGRCIVLTRPRSQTEEWCQALKALGAQPLVCAPIRIAPPPDWQAVDQALSQLQQFDWLIFTSANGVRFFCTRLVETGREVRALRHLKVAAVGPQTARALERYALRADILPASYHAEGLQESLALERGCRVLWPRAAVAQEVLAAKLRLRGVSVTEVVVYQTVQATDDIDTLQRYLQPLRIDVITFTSSSAVTSLHALLGEESWSILQTAVTTACIGPETAATARAAGLQVSVLPSSATVPALTQAIVEYFQVK